MAKKLTNLSSGRAMARAFDSVKGLTPGRNANSKNQFGYERYTQDSEEHGKGIMIALNQKFPNLVGFGVYHYLKQLWALNPRGKIAWSDDNIRMMSLQMNIEERTFRSVVDFCRNELRIFFISRSFEYLTNECDYFLIYPDFMNDLIDLQVKKIRDEAGITNPNVLRAGEQKSAKEIRKEIISGFKEFMILTPEIEKSLAHYFPGLGEPVKLWKMFESTIEKEYLKFSEILKAENYEQMLYVYLNNLKPGDIEYLAGLI